MSLGGGFAGPAGSRDKGLRLSLTETLRQAWADPELRQRILFVLFIFGVYAMGIQLRVPVPGVDPADLERMVQQNSFLQLLNAIGGGAFKRLSIFALGLGPYITASIIMQVLTMGIPQWKKDLQEGGEYARKQQNKRTRFLTIFLCFFQGLGLLKLVEQAVPGLSGVALFEVCIFWTAGAMFLLWLGEQVSEKGIGNGVSLLIFAGIVISIPNLVQVVGSALSVGTVPWWQVLLIILLFLATTWFIVMFTIAQRRIPIQHMRRQFGTKTMGGQTSYLPISVNMAGVIPVIFAIALIYMPNQIAVTFPPGTPLSEIFHRVAEFFNPNFFSWKGWVGAVLYAGLIFFFTYFWNAMMYNVEDIANNLKRSGSYIPGIRPGKQTKDFLDSVISRVTFVGALFLAIVALTQYVFPLVAPALQSANIGLIGGTSLLIMVSVALETMRQIEANLLIKQYGS